MGATRVFGTAHVTAARLRCSSPLGLVGTCQTSDDPLSTAGKTRVTTTEWQVVAGRPSATAKRHWLEQAATLMNGREQPATSTTSQTLRNPGAVWRDAAMAPVRAHVDWRRGLKRPASETLRRQCCYGQSPFGQHLSIGLIRIPPLSTACSRAGTEQREVNDPTKQIPVGGLAMRRLPRAVRRAVRAGALGRGLGLEYNSPFRGSCPMHRCWSRRH